jgi:hypothetical protein
MTTTFFVNIAKPLANSDSNIYHLRDKYHWDGLGAEDYGYIDITIVADCTQETITVPSISDLSYTFKTTAETTNLPQFVSSLPSNCSVEYTLEYYNQATSSFGTISSLADFLTFDNTT